MPSRRRACRPSPTPSSRWTVPVSGSSKVAAVFFHLAHADSNEALQAVEREVAPLLARHGSAITLDEALFARIDALWQARATLGLDAEALRLLERTHTNFVRAGAAVDAAGKKRLAEISERLAEVGTRFSQNVLADENAFTLVLEGEADLAGLPGWLVAAAAEAAAERGLAGKHVITLGRSSIDPFLRYSKRRDLREKAFAAWIARGEGGGATDNRALIGEAIRLRAERARLLGYTSFAHYRLADTMAKTPEAVRGLLESVWAAGRRKALAEQADLETLAAAEGDNFPLAAWDWRFYAEKLGRERFDFDESELKPYLQLDNVIAAAFDTAHRLFGLTFDEMADLPLYDDDVRVWRVSGAGRRTGRRLPRRLFRPARQAERCVDERAPRPAQARRRYPPDRRQRHELRQGAGGPADASVVR